MNQSINTDSKNIKEPQQKYRRLSHDPEALSWTKHVDQTSASGLYNENDQNNEHITCVVVVVCSGLTSISTSFQSYHDGVWLRQGAQCYFYCVASLKYHAPDT